MADITLISGADPADATFANGSNITILNSVVDGSGNPAATTLSCDSGLFTPTPSYPIDIAAGAEISAHVGTSGKDYYYDDPSSPAQGTRTGRINP